MQAEDPGIFRGQCTEFCGLSHANMRMLVRAVPTDEYDQWVENQLKPYVDEPNMTDEALAGKAVWESLCGQCHLINGINQEKLEPRARRRWSRAWHPTSPTS